MTDVEFSPSYREGRQKLKGSCLSLLVVHPICTKKRNVTSTGPEPWNLSIQVLCWQEGEDVQVALVGAQPTSFTKGW